METSNLIVGAVFSMSLHPERITGSTLDDVTFMGRIDASLVSAYGMIPSEEHKKVYATLPNGTPNDGYQYSWLLFRGISGNLTVIGEPWVVAGSVTGGDVEDIWDITSIKGNSETPAIIQDALSSRGIYEYVITKRTS